MKAIAERALPRALRDFLTAELGPVQGLEDLSWDHGESAVWRVRHRQGAAVLKAHRQGGRKFEQELAVYQEWLPRLRPLLEAGTCVPELLASRLEVPRALLLSHEAGEVMGQTSLPAVREAEVHRRAGGFLRTLHALEVHGDDPLTLADAYRRRLDNWSRRAAASVPAGVIADMKAMASEAAPFLAAQRRTPCHRDFTPRNWLVAEAGAEPGGRARLVVIDFEHSRLDLYLEDLLRLYVGEWRGSPALRESFLEGYGRPLTEGEEEALKRLAALWSLSTIHWAREHGDPEFEAAGWSTWEWLRRAPR